MTDLFLPIRVKHSLSCHGSVSVKRAVRLSGFLENTVLRTLFFLPARAIIEIDLLFPSRLRVRESMSVGGREKAARGRRDKEHAMAEQLSQYSKESTRSAERRMRQWALDMEIKQRVADQRAAENLPHEVHPYIAISRDSGAGAGELARRIGEKLGWQVLDREVLDEIAQRFDVDKAMVEAIDETHGSWMLEAFGKWISERVVTNSEYVTRLGKVLLMAAQHESTIFVGRGAQFFLPRERGLTIQIVAPLAMRIERVARRDNLSPAEARRYLIRRDRERRDFVRKHFGHDVTDPHLYDLVVNRAYLDFEWIVDMVVNTCRYRFQFDQS